MDKILLIYFIFYHFALAAEPKDVIDKRRDNKSNASNESLGRIGDYGYPNNPQYDRAIGYLLKGKIKNAVSNSGNFITWDHHPAGFWGEYGYLPHVGFVAGVPGHEYSSHWSSPGKSSWSQDDLANNSIWYSEDAYDAWVEGILDPENEVGNYKTIVYNTVVDIGTNDRGHNDRGDIALELVDYCDGELCLDINNCAELVCRYEDDCQSAGYTWVNVGIAQFDAEKGTQWFLDHELDRLYIYLDDASLDPNYASAGIGLAFPWSIRPKFKSRTEVGGGFYLDLYEYGEDYEEWTCEDIYTYYGATFDESWFIRDGGAGVAVKTDWQASTEARYNTHNLDNTAGDLFGTTQFTDPDDPMYLLAHSIYEETWPEEWNFDTGNYEPYWPGWWADEYYGDASVEVWSDVGIYDCDRVRSDEGCWSPLTGRHISDMDVYMEFDDRWANVGNEVLDNEYIAAGYPMGIKVMSMAHSYGVAYAEDVMFVTVKVRNESGDYCAFEKDKNQTVISIKDENGFPVCNEAMIMPDGTKLNRGKGFDYKKLYLGFYMDADVLSTDATGGFSVHTNNDDFMKYIDCKISKEEYPDGCPVVNNDTLRISMAVIGDYDGISNAAYGYSMETEARKGPDFGVVAVQLLDSPYSTGYIDLDEDGFYDIYPGEKLKMTDWHWFDWYNRPGVLSEGASDSPALNKELIQYQVIAGDNTNLTLTEKSRYFHSDDPGTDRDSEINPHFDSLEGIKSTSFFTEEPIGLDCVLEMSAGPFDLRVGEEVSFSFSIIMGQDIGDLVNNAKFAQIMYNSHYQGYTPPLTPQVKAISGNNRVDLYWDDTSIDSKDVITSYSDFQGYKIYRSLDNGVTWGSASNQILVDGVEEGWQPLSIGCFDNPLEGGGGNCSNKNFLIQASCELNGGEWSFTEFDHSSNCTSFDTKEDCIYTSADSFIQRDTDGDNIVDCYWKFAQFDMSAYEDSMHCVLGKNTDVSGECITSVDCEAPCNRGISIEGPDPEANWFNLGYNTGLEILLLDPYNQDSVMVLENEYGDGNVEYRYKFTDYNVEDGIEYIYSVVAYDGGVQKSDDNYFPANADNTLFNKTSVSAPDPNGWGVINPFKILESPKGTTVLDPNFVKVIPGYLPAGTLDDINVVPNPYIVNSGYNETEYKKRIRFTRLPEICTITIFTISGEKVRELKHNSATDGNLWWDLRSYNNQEIAPGLYIYVVTTPGGNKKLGKFAVVR